MSVKSPAPQGGIARSASADATRPWLGLASFTEETRSVFYGRDDEVAELARRVQRKLLTVLFGQSGLGKTSILRAGLVPKLRPEGLCPIYVRLDHSTDGLSPTEQIKQAVVRASADLGTWSRPGVSSAGESLWEFFHHRDDILTAPDGRVLTPLLIFDQFEEIFTLAQTDDAGRVRAQKFLREFADLIENRAPPSIEDDEAAAERFDFARAEYRLLIALREDYLAHLEGLRDLMPSVTQNRVRLTRMAGGPALETILKPGAGLVNDDVARQIVRFVSGARDLATAEVEPSLLSLVCRELNEVRLARGAPEISADLLEGSRDTILGEFYERTLADQPAAVRIFVEDVLLTDSGYRESVAEERVQKAFADTGAPGALTALVDRRLLRIEERLDVRRVELTHDVLCSVVRASRDNRQEREAKERAERELTATRAREAATRRAMWRARILGLGAAILCVFATFSAIFGYRNMKRAEAAQAAASAQEQYARRLAYASDMVVATQMLEQNNLGRAETLLEGTRPAPGETDLRGWEWRYLTQQVRSDDTGILYDTGEEEINDLALSPDGRLLAISNFHQRGTIVHDLTTGQQRTFIIPDGFVSYAAFSPSEPRLVLAATILFEGSGQTPTQVQVWNTDTWELEREWQVRGTCKGFSFSPDGGELLTAIANQSLPEHQRLIRWRMRDGAELSSIPLPGFQPTLVTQNFAVHAATGRVAYFDYSGKQIRVLDTTTGVELWSAPAEGSYSLTGVAFSPDGSMLATSEGFGVEPIRLWDARTGESRGRLSGHTGWVGQLVFWPDGNKLASASADQTIRIWDLKTMTSNDVLRGHRDEVWRLALLPDAHTLISGSKDGVVATWDTSHPHPRHAFLTLPESAVRWLFAPDGQSILTWGNGRITRWSGRDFSTPEVLMDYTAIRPFDDLEYSTDGRWAAFSKDEKISIWDLATGEKRFERATVVGGELEHLDGFVPGQDVLVSGNYVGKEYFWSFREGTPVKETPLVLQLRFRGGSPDGTQFALGNTAGEIAFIDLASQTSTIRKLDFVEGSGVAFSPDNRWLAVSSHLGYLRVWDTRTWEVVVTLRGFRNGANAPTFSPDGSRLAASSGGGNEGIKIWATDSWREVLTLRGEAAADSFSRLNFSPDGNWLGARAINGTVHLWYAPTWEEIDRDAR